MSLQQLYSLLRFGVGVGPDAGFRRWKICQVDMAGSKSGLPEQAVSVQCPLPDVSRMFNFVFLSQPLPQLPGVVFMGPVRRACAFLQGSSLPGLRLRKIPNNSDLEVENGLRYRD